MNGSGGAWKSSDNEAVGVSNGDGLRPVTRDGLNARNAERVVIQVNNFGDFTLNGRNNGGDVGNSGGFGQTSQRNRSIGAHEKGIGIVGNVQIGIVFGRVRPFLVFLAVTWFREDHFAATIWYVLATIWKWLTHPVV